jgi:hypothetical protein
VWAVFIGRALLVSTDVSQPIQKIIGIGWITSADTNNVPGIRGVPPPTRNPNHGEICFCAVRLSNLGAASLGAASLDAAPSSSPTPSLTPPSASTPAAASPSSSPTPGGSVTSFPSYCAKCFPMHEICLPPGLCR